MNQGESVTRSMTCMKTVDAARPFAKVEHDTPLPLPPQPPGWIRRQEDYCSSNEDVRRSHLVEEIAVLALEASDEKERSVRVVDAERGGASTGTGRTTAAPVLEDIEPQP